MKNLYLFMMMGASLSLAACGQDAGVGEEEVQASENAVAGQPGELGTVEGSFDLAGEGSVNSDHEAKAQDTGEAP